MLATTPLLKMKIEINHLIFNEQTNNVFLAKTSEIEVISLSDKKSMLEPHKHKQ